jgi:hypothetical protein
LSLTHWFEREYLDAISGFPVQEFLYTTKNKTI